MNPGRAHKLEGKTFDLVVVGGGIIGAGVARDASLRGLEVALLEKGDYGRGTTAGSTRLIHGGLRYLELLDFRLVRMDLREREVLLATAPHLVRPLEFLLPFYGRSLVYRMKMRMGMLLYDALSFDKSLPCYRYLSRSQVLALEPNLHAESLQGAVSYYDAQVALPERLCLENLLDARAHGACLANYAEVTGVVRRGSSVAGVRVRDLLEGVDFVVRARTVVNATGPWLDRVACELDPGWRPRLRTTKGIHIACPPVSRRAVVLFSKVDGRLFFVIPWLGHSWIGTTDTDFQEDPALACASGEDVRYLLESVREYFPAPEIGSIRFSNAGVRALVRRGGSESSVSRLHRVVDGDRFGTPGLISILGGKITGYRAIAEEVTNLVCRKLKVRRPCLTAMVPLPGGRGLSGEVEGSGLPASVLSHLRLLYGSRAEDVADLAAADPRLSRPLAAGGPDIAAQVVFAAREEDCAHAEDFLLRRTMLGFSEDQGRKALPAVIDWMAGELGWSAGRKQRELESCGECLARAQVFRDDLEVAREGLAP